MSYNTTLSNMEAPNYVFVNFDLTDGYHQMSRDHFNTLVERSPMLSFLVFGREGFQLPVLDIDPFGVLHVNLEPYRIEVKIFRSVVSCVLGQSRVPKFNSAFVRTAEALGFYAYLQEQIEAANKNEDLACLDPLTDVKGIFLWMSSTHVYEAEIVQQGYTLVGSAFMGGRIVYHYRKPNPDFRP